MLKQKVTCYPQNTESEAILIEFRENGPFDLDMRLFDISVVAKANFAKQHCFVSEPRGFSFESDLVT